MSTRGFEVSHSSQKLGNYAPSKLVSENSLAGVTWGHILSHPACQSKPLECFGMFFSGFATCVYSLCGAPPIVTCQKSVFIRVSADKHLFNEFQMSTQFSGFVFQFYLICLLGSGVGCK